MRSPQANGWRLTGKGGRFEPPKRSQFPLLGAGLASERGIFNLRKKSQGTVLPEDVYTDSKKDNAPGHFRPAA